MTRERVLPSLFLLAVLFCLLGCPAYAGAQSTGANESLSSSDVAGSGDNLSTYSGSSSLKKFGIDDTQPQRTDDQGNVVDKNENPFGTSNKVVVSNTSLATAGFGADTFYIKDTSDGTLAGGSLVMNDTSSSNWADMPKVMTAANIKGTDGYQQVLTAVLVPKSGNYNLELVVEDYNGGGKANTPSKYILQLAQGLTMPQAYISSSPGIPSEVYKSHFRIVACAGRVAIVVNRTLYDYHLTYSGGSYNAALMRSTTFDGSNAMAPIASSDTPMIDLKSGDPNYDGLQELVMTVSSAEGTNPGHLLIYKWENNNDSGFSQPVYNLNPSQVYVNGKELDISVTVGNITGSGDAVLMGNYFKADSGWYWSYVMFDRNKNQFDYYRGNRIDEITKDNDTNVKNEALPAMTCVSFSAPQAGAAQYVFYDGFVLQYNQDTDELDLIYTPPQLTEKVKKGNVSVDPIYSDSAAGNLFHYSSDAPGVQQLAVLLQDPTYGTYGVRAYFVNNGKITSIWDDSSGNVFPNHILDCYYPAFTGAVVKDKFFSLKFESASFAMSDPKVVAILGASPYYKEFEDEYGNGWNCESTRLGTSTSSGKETSNALTIKAGATIGTDFEMSAGLVVQQKIAEFEAEVNVSDEFTTQWSSAKTVSVGRSFSAVADDMVVVSSIPYDIYRYQISDPGQPDDGQVSTLKVPYEPRLSLMSLSDYNNAVAEINTEKNAAVADAIPASVMAHTIGDPRTYQSSMNSFSDQTVDKKSVLSGDAFVGVGTGNGISEQTIAIEKESSTAFNNVINVDISFKATIGSFTAGFSRGAGWDCGVTISNGTSTELAGSVVNLPPSRANYDFTWELVAYMAHLPSGDCPAINYLVKTAQVPPPAPENFQLLSYSGTSVIAAWDAIKDSNLKQYMIYRSTSKNIDATKQPYANVTVFPQTGQVKFSDVKLQQSQQYYYEIVAEDSYQGALKDSLPSDILAVPALITSLAIKSQPQLQYNDGDTLDLSGLVLTAAMSDGSGKDLTLADLKKRGASFSISNGTILSLDENGVPVYITDPMTQLLVLTNPLTITKNSTNTSVSSISFTVGSTDNAAWLAAGQKLTAHIGITNNQSSPQAVIAIVALFDPNGTMCAVNYATQTIDAGASKTIDVGGFTLPSTISGYSAKAFLVEGTEFDTSSLRPLSRVGEIDAQSPGNGSSNSSEYKAQGDVVYTLKH